MQPASTNDAALAEPGTWASSLGERWKYLQTSLAGETPQDRQVFLEEELRRALQAIPAAKRGAYLDAVAARYPAWEMAAVFANNPAKVARQTPDEVIASFLQLAPQLTGPQREDVKQKLAALGLIVQSTQPVDGEALTDMQAKLKLEPADKIDAQRLGKLFVIYADAMLALDQLAWSVWSNLNSKSAIRRDVSLGELRTVTRKALTGDGAITPAQVQKQLEASGKLLVGLLNGLGQAGKNFGNSYQQRYTPDAIREVVRAEGGKSDVQFWKKYTELASSLSDTLIVDEVQEAVVKYVEDLFRNQNK